MLVRSVRTIALAALATGFTGLVAPALPLAATSAAATGTTTTFLTRHTSTGTGQWSTSSHSIVLTGGPRAAQVKVTATSGASFTVQLGAPTGQTLAVGTYANTLWGPTATRPSLSVENCSDGKGWFVVEDVHLSGSTIDRLSARWVVYCGNRTSPESGQVVVNEPVSDAELLTMGSAVDFPEAYPNTVAGVAGTRYVNTGTAPVTIDQADIVGADAASFAITSSTCTTIPVGDSCVIKVQSKPLTPGRKTASLVVSDTTSVGFHTTALSGEGITGTTNASFADLPGESGTGTYEIPGATSTFTGSGFPQWVAIGYDKWWVEFTAADGDVLTPGVPVTRAPEFPIGGANLYIDSPGNGCASTGGGFTVQEIAFDAITGELARFAATFAAQCEGGRVLQGFVNYRALRPIVGSGGIGHVVEPPEDLTPPSPVTGVKVRTAPTAVTLTWSDPADDDLATTVVRVAQGTAPPATADDGAPVALTGHRRVTYDGIVPGRDYAFAVFARDTNGNTSAPTTAVVRGTTLALTRDKTTVSYDTTVRVAVTLNATTTHAALGGRSVTFYRRDDANKPWAVVGRVATSSTGRATIALRPSRETQYMARFAGTATETPSTSGTVGAAVNRIVTLSASARSVSKGRPITFRGGVTPSSFGQQVRLQRWSGGKWHTVRSTRVSESGRYKIALKATKKGTFKYRTMIGALAGLGGDISPTRSVEVRK